MNRPAHAAEVEAWTLAGAPGVWRPPAHPRYTEQKPSLDWAGARGAHDVGAAPWPQVRELLTVIEATARKVSPERADGG